MDYLEKQNALAEKELEARLRSIYKQAYKGVKKTADDYLDDLEGRIKTEFKKYEAGDYTPAEFAQWVKTQEARGERYKKMVDDIATRAVNVNKTASDIINGVTPSAYALNANYTAYQIEKGYNMANFELVNEEALKSVLDGTNNVEFRTVKTNPVRDYAWNKKQIENGLLAGILQGQSIPKLAGTFLQVMGRNENSAYRNARTALGSACNAGTLNTMKRGEDMGINVRKQWQSAKDGRVRDSHAFLNGQIRDIDKPFDNGLMYPCDSSGHPSEVYNCRCRLAYILPKYNDEQSREAYSDDKQGNESYSQWLKRKQQEQKRTLDPIATPTPAKNEELTNRRKQRLAERNKTPQANTIDFSKMNAVELKNYANNILKTEFAGMDGANNDFIRETVKIIDNFEKINGGTLDGLRVQFGGTPTGVYAKFDDKTNTLLLKKTGSLEAIEEKMIKDNIRYRRKWKTDKDYYAVPTYGGTVAHELGHAVDVANGQKLSRKLSSTQELDELSVKISAYAGTTQNVRVTKRSEAWAENFSAYIAGGSAKQKIPSLVKAIIDDFFNL